MTQNPLISIGMPAYNAAGNIGFAIAGLLSQSFGDFEIIISDNASTDGTRDVVEEYRRRDPRIRYERQPANIGANPNYSYVVRAARGRYFKWSSSSDWCAPDFLKSCLSELLAHPGAVLAAPRTRLFHETPSTWQDYGSDIEIPDDTPSARLARLVETLALNNAMNGLIRVSALRRTRLVEVYRGADIVMMGHLALLGKFRLIEERLYYRRMETTTATALQDREAVRRHHYPQRSAHTLLQGCKRHVGWLRAVLSAPMPLDERWRCLLYVMRACYWERGIFLKDLSEVWRYLTRGTLPD